MNRTTRRKSGPGLGLTAKIALATAAAAAVVTGVGVGAATASTTSTDSYSFEAFRETIKPWDSISIPALSCPTGYFTERRALPRPHRPQGRRGPGAQRHRRHHRRGEEHAREGLVEQAALPGHEHRPRQRILDRHQLGPDQQQRADHPAALHHGPDQGVHGPVALQLICGAHDRTSPGRPPGDVLVLAGLLAALLEGHLGRALYDVPVTSMPLALRASTAFCT